MLLRTSRQSVMNSSSSRRSSAVAFKVGFSPKKLHLGTSSKPQLESVVDNNEDEKQRAASSATCSDAQVEKNRELAAALLQHQVQLWMLRRQETLRTEEVTVIRGKLRKAAVLVIEESYSRYAKRRAIGKYLREFEDFEAKVNNLLQICVVRKHEMEEVQRFASLRRQQKQQEEDRMRKLVYNWLTLCIQTRRKEHERKVTKAHEQLIGWIRRWTLWKRCEARVTARERGIQEEERRRSSAQRIVAVYRAYRLCCRAKVVAQRQIRLRGGMKRLCRAFRLGILRNAQSHWVEWILEQKLARKAVATVQRVYRGYQARIQYAKVVVSCQTLQRVFRGHQARVFCKEIQRVQRQKARERLQMAAATVIQRLARGFLTRLWFRGVLLKLRERFRCANCSAVEPGGTYCKYCGRHRPSFVAFSNILMLHETWQQQKCSSMVTTAEEKGLEVLTNGISVPVAPPPKKPTFLCGRSSSLRLQTPSSTIELLSSLPAVMSPRHRRLAARSKPIPMRRNSIASISEQTALRAMAIADLQVKFTAATQVNVLEMHLNRQQKAYKAINR